jgi:hypothetical protein
VNSREKPAPAVNSHSTSTTMAISLLSAARMYPAGTVADGPGWSGWSR